VQKTLIAWRSTTNP